MKSFIFIFTFINLFILVNSVSCAKLAIPSVLEIELEIECIKNGEDITIDVNVINLSKEYVAFYNKFFLDKRESLATPTSNLKIFVNDGSGEKELEYKGEQLAEKIKTPGPNDFLILGPNFFWGQRISINKKDFIVNFNKGKYLIKAVYENRSGSWLRKAIEKGKFSLEDFDFELNKLFDGHIESNTIKFEVY